MVTTDYTSNMAAVTVVVRLASLSPYVYNSLNVNK